jgi:hypothetical protein
MVLICVDWAASNTAFGVTVPKRRHRRNGPAKVSVTSRVEPKENRAPLGGGVDTHSGVIISLHIFHEPC